MSEDSDAELVDVLSIDASLVVELRYAGSDNIVKQAVYPNGVCRLARGTALRLARAQERLRPAGLRLKVWDGYRPLSVQKKLWQLLPDQRFVAPPERGSRHNHGAAVDVTLVDAAGRELEMPSGFDEFGESAGRAWKDMAPAARKNLDVLEDAMLKAGFLPLPEEWWHYDDPDWTLYPVRDLPTP